MNDKQALAILKEPNGSEKLAAQAEEAKQQRTAQKQKPATKKKTQGYEASYDIDEFDRRSETAPLVYKKKTDEGEG